MHQYISSQSGRRNRPLATVLVLVTMLLAVVALVPVAWAATTTTSNEPAASTTTTGSGDSTTTTAGEATPPSSSGLLPPPDGFEPPNPGLILADMGIQFWPEYDTNDILVLLDVTLPATTVFPYEFTFFVPSGARLAGIAEIDENGNFDYALGVPTVVPGEVMDTVTVTIPKRPVLRLEWYYDPGVGAPGAKAYQLDFQAPAEVGRMPAAVQQPRGATGFSAGPLFTQTSTDAQGFTYYFTDFSAVKAGEMLQIPVEYTRTDTEPSIPAGGAATDPTQEKSSSYLLWLFIVLVVAVGGVVVYRLFIRKPSAPAPKGSSASRTPKGGSKTGAKGGGVNQRTARKSAASAGDAGAGPARFCTQCGGRLTKKDRFCPQCGAERDQ